MVHVVDIEFFDVDDDDDGGGGDKLLLPPPSLSIDNGNDFGDDVNVVVEEVIGDVGEFGVEFDVFIVVLISFKCGCVEERDDDLGLLPDVVVVVVVVVVVDLVVLAAVVIGDVIVDDDDDDVDDDDCNGDIVVVELFSGNVGEVTGEFDFLTILIDERFFELLLLLLLLLRLLIVGDTI